MTTFADVADRFVRRGMGAVQLGSGTISATPNAPPLAPPAGPDAEALYQRNAFALHTVEAASRGDAKTYGIASAIAFSLGASVALSASDTWRSVGAVLAGAGVAGGAIAMRSQMRATEAASIKNRYVRALVAAGVSSSVPMTEGV